MVSSGRIEEEKQIQTSRVPLTEGQAHEIQRVDAFYRDDEGMLAFVKERGTRSIKSPQNVLRELPQDREARKVMPVTTGVIDYFPLALIEIAKISKAGNDQHNPGEPLHWNRAKSSDHADCIVRHLIERGTVDTDGMRHSAKIAWRALALLQEELEAEAGFVPVTSK